MYISISSSYSAAFTSITFNIHAVYTTVPPAALSAGATPRLRYMAEPKPHKIWHDSLDTTPEGLFSEPITMVTPNARRAT